MSSTHLHSQQLDLCLICLFEPESDRNVKFVHILTSVNGEIRVKELISELLGINVESTGVKPKIICENCHKSLIAYREMKKKAAESEIIINYLASKKFGVNMPRTSVRSTPSVMIKNEGESSQESSFLHSHLSQRSNMYGASTSRLSIASTSSQFGVNMPRTSVTSTPSVMIKNDGDSSQESSYQHSHLSQRSNIYGASTSRLSVASTSSQGIINNGESSSIRQSQLISNSGFVDDSDDDSDNSCIDVTTPIPSVDLISDDDDNDNIKHCLRNQANNVSAAKMKLKKPTVNETSLLPVIPNNINNVRVRKNENKNKIPLTSEQILFTCLKPSCNLIFQTFSKFKIHHRLHFNLGKTLICWQCCKPFNNLTHLRAHQVKYNCRTPGMFQCSVCPEKFDDIESFSMHKFNYHEGNLEAARKTKKTIMCAFCQMDINIFNFQSHLITCQKKNVNKNTSTKKHDGTFNCLACGKVFLSPTSLSKHLKIHNTS